MHLPHDKELEAAVLGTIISNRYGYDKVRDIVNEECFHDTFHRQVFLIFKEIEAKGNEPDAIAIASEYRRQYNELKAFEVTALCDNSETANIYTHTCRLGDLAVRRNLIELGQFLQTKGGIEQEDIADLARHAGDCLGNMFARTDNPVTTIRDAVKGVYDIIDRNKSGGSPLTGSPTGFPELDRQAGGLQKSDLIIVAGETSQGKTSFTLSLLNNTVKHGTKVAVYSLEMKKEQLAARLMAMESGIPASQLLYMPLEDKKFRQLDKSVNSLCNACILFDDRSTSNIDTIIHSIRTMVLRHGIDGAVIDYLQILNVNTKMLNKEQQMADVARRLKNLAKELDIWIIALSQLNRDAANPLPTLNRLRDSGQIGEAADIVAFVYRPEYYGRSFPEPFGKYDTAGMALIDVAKGRNIGLLKFLAAFDKKTTRFYTPDSLPVAKVREDEPY